MNHDNRADLTASEAAALLGVKPATLYAYVSRGLLRSAPSGSGRARRYLRADVEALRARRGGDRAEAALRWGEPVLETGITEMTPEGPRYRGRLATDLAREGIAFERVAELLWTGVLPDAVPVWHPPGSWPGHEALLALGAGERSIHGWCSLAVAALAARDPGRHDTRAAAVLPRARALIRALAASLALPHDPALAEEALAAPSLAESVAAATGVRPRPGALRAIDQVLVLMADHELNASTFAARVVASTRADPYAAVQAGLATLSGPLHGAASDHVEALLQEVRRPENAQTVLLDRDRRGERMPGFGHPFYSHGDPRSALLFDAAFELRERAPELRRLGAIAEAMAAAGRPPPNVDVGVVAIRAALGMPRGAGSGLFIVGRCAGWIAHVLEQYREGHLIRPRARYRPSR